MHERPKSPTRAGLSRRTFLLIGTASGIALTLASPPAPAVAAPDVAAAAATDRPHRTLLGLL